MNYLISGPSAGSPEGQLWSSSRLPFEPKRWLLQLLADLVAALCRLPAVPMLHAYYASPVVDRCDIENLLFYNVGVKVFARISGRGIRFERSYKLPAPPGV